MRTWLAIGLLLAAGSAFAQPVLFLDTYDGDTLGNYAQACFSGGRDGTNWQVVDGVLRGTVPNGDGCYVEVSDPSWSIEKLDFRFRTVDGAVRGISLATAAGQVRLTVRSSPELVCELDFGDAQHVSTLHFGVANGKWLSLKILLIASHYIDVGWNENDLFFGDLAPSLQGQPFTALRLWTSGGSTAEFDNVVLYGAGSSAAEPAGWGTLKSRYR